MQNTIHFIGRNSKEYPARFAHLSKMPDGLYVIGKMPENDVPSVAIIGARMCSAYGRNTAFAFGKKLAESGISVISGMALGIDGAAQEGALAGGGSTFAVLGCGVDVCYPRSNLGLYDQIPRCGGILSEFPPGTKPYSYNFPQRNRLISALADVVVVVEAREKSGSFITVDYALEQGKSVFAVPGRVGDVLSEGCNRLIAEGAGIAWSVDVLLEEIRMLSSLSEAARASRKAAAERLKILERDGSFRKEEPSLGDAKKMTPDEESVPDGSAGREADGAGPFNEDVREGTGEKTLRERIFMCLGSDEKTLDDLTRELDIPVPKLNAALGEMLLFGDLEESGRNRYMRRK